MCRGGKPGFGQLVAPGMGLITPSIEPKTRASPKRGPAGEEVESHFFEPRKGRPQVGGAAQLRDGPTRSDDSTRGGPASDVRPYGAEDWDRSCWSLEGMGTTDPQPTKVDGLEVAESKAASLERRLGDLVDDRRK